MNVGALDTWQEKHGSDAFGWEMRETLRELSRMEHADVVLEIGTFRGDSLRVWREILDPRLLIGIQDTDETTPETASEVGATMVRGKSQSLEAYAEVLRLLGADRLDLLYIDGNHMYPYVRRDWDLYAPLVHRGGIVVLHDAVIEDNSTVEVYRFYREVREGRRSKLLYGGHGSTGTAIVFV